MHSNFVIVSKALRKKYETKTRMTTLIINIDKYRAAANKTEYHIVSN